MSINDNQKTYILPKSICLQKNGPDIFFISVIMNQFMLLLARCWASFFFCYDQAFCKADRTLITLPSNSRIQLKQ